MKTLSELQQRVLDISKDLGLSHIGSNISVLPILIDIYSTKKPEDKVILDNAHAHLAHLIIRDEWVGDGATSNASIKDMIKDFGIHCDKKANCDASGGSLGHGLGISIGLAIANPKLTVHCIVSDGSMQEGSNWEALRLIKHLNIKNIKIYANLNGYTAVAKIDRDELVARMRAFLPDINVYYTDNGKQFTGLKGHYEKIIL